MVGNVIAAGLKKNVAAAVASFRFLSYSAAMSHSKYEYVRGFESDDRLLPNCWIVVRVDGKTFHRFSDEHAFEKPNDKRSLDLMNAAARRVLRELNEIVLAYGQSDEYSFVFRRDAGQFHRRASKVGKLYCSLSIFF